MRVSTCLHPETHGHAFFIRMGNATITFCSVMVATLSEEVLA